MKRTAVMIIVMIACAACTGGDMGNTRGGGAAPGQSGGRDTGTGSAGTGTPAAGAPTSSKAGATGTSADTTKRSSTSATKRP